MVCPVWESQTQQGDRTFGTFDGVVYDITDLLDSM
jgi:hypothetical protein